MCVGYMQTLLFYIRDLSIVDFGMADVCRPTVLGKDTAVPLCSFLCL